MTSVQRLAIRLKKDLDIDMDVKSFRRLYGGYWQRKAGQWSWAANIIGKHNHCVGSQWAVKKLLQAEVLVQYRHEYNQDTSIIPERKPVN